MTYQPTDMTFLCFSKFFFQTQFTALANTIVGEEDRLYITKCDHINLL